MGKLKSFKNQEYVEPANVDFPTFLTIPNGMTLLYAVQEIDKYEYKHDETVKELEWRKGDDGKTFYRLTLEETTSKKVFVFEREPHYTMFKTMIEHGVAVGNIIKLYKIDDQYGRYELHGVYDDVEGNRVVIWERAE